MSLTLKNRLGCWIHERKDAEWVLRAPRLAKLLGRHWLDLCNRHERLSIEAETGGRICHWTDSSPLTVARVFPEVGGRLLQRCLEEWPFEFANEARWPASGQPDVTFLVAVRGLGRLSQVQTVLSSLLAQEDCICEVIVVEQSDSQEFADRVPRDVSYLHTPLLSPSMPFNKSWALNVAARAARGRILVVQDADMVAPKHYARAIRDTIDQGFEAIRVPRLIFYLSESDTASVARSRNLRRICAVDQVVQNNPTPVAILREAYFSIGGHDEAFYAWGAEDLEFLDRARSLRFSDATFLPIVHLWHPLATNRSGDRNMPLLQARRDMPLAQRVQRLVNSHWGGQTPTVKWNGPGAEALSSATTTP
jgi:hypothetical protein